MRRVLLFERARRCDSASCTTKTRRAGYRSHNIVSSREEEPPTKGSSKSQAAEAEEAASNEGSFEFLGCVDCGDACGLRALHTAACADSTRSARRSVAVVRRVCRGHMDPVVLLVAGAFHEPPLRANTLCAVCPCAPRDNGSPARVCAAAVHAGQPAARAAAGQRVLHRSRRGLCAGRFQPHGARLAGTAPLHARRASVALPLSLQDTVASRAGAKRCGAPTPRGRARRSRTTTTRWTSSWTWRRRRTSC